MRKMRTDGSRKIEFSPQPARHGAHKGPQARRSGRRKRFQHAGEFPHWFLVVDHGIDVCHAEAGLRQHS